MKKFSIIYADPPWDYNNNVSEGAAASHYKTLGLSELSDLPVSGVSAEDSILFLWGTWPLLPETLSLIQGWGFEYKTCGVLWIKTNKNFNPGQASFFPVESFDSFFGCGNYTRANSEFCLIGTRGKFERKDNSVFQLVYEPLGKHSEKPEKVHDLIVRLCGDLPRLELFARKDRPGWLCLGNELTGRDIREELKEMFSLDSQCLLCKGKGFYLIGLGNARETCWRCSGSGRI